MSKCPDCMYEWDGKMCALCGYHSGAALAVPNALKPGTKLNNRYDLGNALCVNRQSIAYAAWDRQLECRVIITEFYPAVIVKRIQDDVQPVRNQMLFATAMNRYHAYEGSHALPMEQAFFGNRTCYRVYLPTDQPQLKLQAELLLDEPILFRDDNGRPQMTINALMIDPLPKKRPYSRVVKPRKKKTFLAVVLVLLMASCVAVLSILGTMTNGENAAKETINETASTALEATVAATTVPTEATTPAPTMTATPESTAEVTAIYTAVPTAFPTLDVGQVSWYLKVNGQLWMVNTDNQATPIDENVENMELNTFSVVGLKQIKDVYAIDRILLRSEEKGTEFDLSDCEQEVVELELPDGWYILTVSREMAVAESDMFMQSVLIQFASVERNAYLNSTELTDLFGSWEELFVQVKVIEKLKQTGTRFYAINDSYYSIDKDGGLKVLDEQEKNSFCLMDVQAETDPLLAVKIPLYPVQTPVQELDHRLFDRAVLTDANRDISDLDQDILPMLLGEGDDLKIYASQGDYKLVMISDKFVTSDGKPYTLIEQFNVNEEGKLPELDQTGIKENIFRNCGLWAYQMGRDTPVICGGMLDPESLLDIFGELLEKNEDFSLQDVSFTNVSMGGKMLASADARVQRGGESILLADLLIPGANVTAAEEIAEDHLSAESPADDMEGKRDAEEVKADAIEVLTNAADAQITDEEAVEKTTDVTELGAENPAEEKPDAGTEDVELVMQTEEKTVADLVEIDSIQGLKLTSGTYVFYPTGDDAVKIELTVDGDTKVTLNDDEQLAVRQSLLQKLSEVGNGYIASVDEAAEGVFVYHIDDGMQVMLTVAEVNELNVDAVSEQQKCAVTFDFKSCNLKAREKESLRVEYIGQEIVGNPAKLSFCVTEETGSQGPTVNMEMFIKWEGKKMMLILGPGSYRLGYAATNGKSIIYTEPFTVSEDLTLVMKYMAE